MSHRPICMAHRAGEHLLCSALHPAPTPASREHTVRCSTSGTRCLHIKGRPPTPTYDLLAILEKRISCFPDGPSCISTESILWLPHLQPLFPCPCTKSALLPPSTSPPEARRPCPSSGLSPAWPHPTSLLSTHANSLHFGQASHPPENSYVHISPLPSRSSAGPRLPPRDR